MMPLRRRLNRRLRSASGTIHRAYLCDGRAAHHDQPRLHPWCSLRFEGLRAPQRAPVTCKTCLRGGSAWAAFVNGVDHVELDIRKPAA